MSAPDRRVELYEESLQIHVRAFKRLHAARRELDAVILAVKGLARGEDGNDPPATEEARELYLAEILDKATDVLGSIAHAEHDVDGLAGLVRAATIDAKDYERRESGARKA